RWGRDVSFYSDAGFGTPAFDLLTHHERAWFDPGGEATFLPSYFCLPPGDPRLGAASGKRRRIHAAQHGAHAVAALGACVRAQRCSRRAYGCFRPGAGVWQAYSAAKKRTWAVRFRIVESLTGYGHSFEMHSPSSVRQLRPQFFYASSGWKI